MTKDTNRPSPPVRAGEAIKLMPKPKAARTAVSDTSFAKRVWSRDGSRLGTYSPRFNLLSPW